MTRCYRGLGLGALLIVACLLLRPHAEAGGEGWIDLMPGPNLKGWTRVPIAPDTMLNDKNAWSLDPSGKVLLCDGVGVKEMLLHESEFGDGTFHVEWRFRKVEGKKDYNSGIYVRTSSDGKVWHQAQVAHPEKAPRLGDLFGDTLEGGKVQKFLAEGRGTALAHPPGEWNTYDIVCEGPKITVNVNGERATVWDQCQVRRGHVGMQAEFFFIEFKNLRFKPAGR
jgi:hypothetical protein